MRRYGHHDRVNGNTHMKRSLSSHRVQQQINELSYLQSAELVTPCRLFLVLIGSVVMILLISLSISSDEITSSPYHTDNRVNLTKEPYHVNYKTVQQMREEMLLHYGYSSSENKVEKRSDISLQEFWDLYDGKWPIVILDIVPKWHAYKKWGKDFFSNNYGADRIILKAVEGVLDEGVAHIRDMKSFISHLEQPSQPDSWTYMEDEMFLMLRPELKKHIGNNVFMEENFFNLFPYEVRPWDCMMLWGTKYSRSTLHMDPYNWTAISAVIWGRKKWKLFPPGQDHNLYIQPGNKCGFPLECNKYDSIVDAFEPDYWKFPKFRKVHYLEVEQNSGEMLIIPSGWYHQAFNDEETLSISMELMNRNNYLVVLEEIIKGKNLSRKKLPAHFHTLLPPDQVKLFMSLLPKKILKHGKEVNDDLINTLDIMRNQTSDLQQPIAATTD
ncbi:uncharacterized protein LOC132736717 isoform X2 [Ruditapes philippinarum]|nr:uncharacterized protein LOC132736717 isoform X2 [Ruditapes philippinarum]XP_060579896.1 uncharacterized protein LOC132736717 isoform X2 [Ruditapes philippinarum]